MSIARPHTVLFDLDGTLVDTIPLIVASYQHALATVLGRGEDERVIRSWIGRTLRSVLRSWRPIGRRTLRGLHELEPGAHERAVATDRRRAGNCSRLSALRGSRRGGDFEAARDGAARAGRGQYVGPHSRCWRRCWTPLGTSPYGTRCSTGSRSRRAGGGRDLCGGRCGGCAGGAGRWMGSIAVLWGAGEAEALVAAKPDAVCRACRSCGRCSVRSFGRSQEKAETGAEVGTGWHVVRRATDASGVLRIVDL